MIYNRVTIHTTLIWSAAAALVAAGILGAGSVHADTGRLSDDTRAGIRAVNQERLQDFRARQDSRLEARRTYVDALRAFQESDRTDADKDDLKSARAAYREALKANRAEYRETLAEWRSGMKDVAQAATPEERARMQEIRAAVKEQRAERFSKRCERFTNRTGVQNGFAAVYNPLSAQREQWMSVKCDAVTGDYSVEAGADDGTTYIYQYGYRWDNGWKRFEFDTVDGEKRGGWIIGTGFADFDTELDEKSDATHMVAYQCKRVNGRFRCGCSDSACTQPKWALQTLDPDDEFEELEEVIEETEEDDEIVEDNEEEEYDDAGDAEEEA